MTHVVVVKGADGKQVSASFVPEDVSPLAWHREIVEFVARGNSFRKDADKGRQVVLKDGRTIVAIVAIKA